MLVTLLHTHDEACVSMAAKKFNSFQLGKCCYAGIFRPSIREGRKGATLEKNTVHEAAI